MSSEGVLNTFIQFPLVFFLLPFPSHVVYTKKKKKQLDVERRIPLPSMRFFFFSLSRLSPVQLPLRSFQLFPPSLVFRWL